MLKDRGEGIMEISIINMLKEKCVLSIDDFSNVFHNTEDDIWIIVSESILSSGFTWPKVKSITEGYEKSVIIELGNVYLNISTKMVLIRYEKKTVTQVMVGLYDGDVYKNNNKCFTKNGGLFLPECFSEEYRNYLNDVERWIKSGNLPKQRRLTEYKVVPMEEMPKEYFNLKYFTDRAISVRKLLAKEKLVMLGQIADIIIPHTIRDGEVGRIISIGDMKYPLEPDELRIDTVTDVKLLKGDILFPAVNSGVNKPYLFRGCEVDIYPSRFMFIIRCRDILPEYLFLYLCSETAQIIIETSASGSVVQRLSYKAIQEMPIVIPELDDEKYIEDYEKMVAVAKRVYASKGSDRVEAYMKEIERIKNKEKEAEKIEDILNVEFVTKIKMHNEEQLKSFLTDDLEELNTCFKGKAFKATLILAGSILEAVLIDWLSEINHEDYFENDYYVTDRYGKQKRADLIDYIDAIKEIERPKWMDEANKAHEIRKKRNLVHAKLCMKSDEINEDVCREVIGYLNDVLKTRIGNA